jgi:hypothetical protein
MKLKMEPDSRGPSVKMDKFFPKLETQEDIKKAIRNGGIAGLAFAAMALIGILFVVFAGSLPGDPSYSADDQLYSMIGIGIELGIILFLTWRFWAGRGYVSGILMLCLFVFEAVFKILGGTSGVAWIFLYFAIALSLVNGIRSCFAFRRAADTQMAADAF